MTKHFHTDIVKHETTIQDFDWEFKRYDCIFGCWCFCYLDEEERQNAVVGIAHSLKDDGYFIIFEPILKENETAE